MAANGANDAAVRGFLHQLLHSIVRQIENNDGHGDNGDGVLYRVDWLYNCLVRYVGSYNIDENIVRLVGRSRDMLEEIANAHSSNRQSFEVGRILSGNRGRPRLGITREQLEFLMERGFRIRDVAGILGVNVRTIERRCREMDLSAAQMFTAIDDQTLDATVADIVRRFPSFGYRRMTGAPLSRGIKVQQLRIRKSMRRVNPDGVLLRALTIHTVNRRTYCVPSPLSLWHVDGNHKLIRLATTFKRH